MFTRAVPKNSKEKKKITMEKPWKYLWRAGPSRFDSSSTAEQVTEGIDATNLTAIVTGATNGIGKETARVLAQRGAKVIITARNLELGLRVKESLLRQNPSGNLNVMQLDLSSLNSVTSFARSFLASNRPLNILINNAGILKGHFLLSVDGTELNFATNHLGHFVLTNLLLEKMKTTAKETGREGRIVNVSSMAHAYTNKHGIQFDKINDPSKYKPFHAYGQSKLANILHANELSRRLRARKKPATMERLRVSLGRDRSSGFGSTSTAEQVTKGVDATNLTAIVTGATSGIGKEAARVLALRGATVIITARSLESGLRLKESFLDQNPNAKLEVMEMDLASLNSVRSFAQSFLDSNRPLNILINNAGILGGPFQLSEDGIELQFATNYLGPFLLTRLLLDKLKTTAKETGIEGRIVNVSSKAHHHISSHGIRFDTLNSESEYKPYCAYGESKLAIILHTNELSRRLHEEGANVTANSLHPGIIKTKIDGRLDFSVLVVLVKFLLLFELKTTAQGASTTCFLALHPSMRGVTGKYFVDCNEKLPSSKARDEDLGKRLWEFSLELIKNHSEKHV